MKEMLLFLQESHSSAISCGTFGSCGKGQGRAKSAPRAATQSQGGWDPLDRVEGRAERENEVSEGAYFISDFTTEKEPEFLSPGRSQTLW